MTTIRVILQLHYLSGEIRLVCIFTGTVSFKSDNRICPILRNEATGWQQRVSFSASHSEYLPQASQNQKSLKPAVTSETLEATLLPSTQEHEKGCKGTHGSIYVCRYSTTAMLIPRRVGHETPWKDAAGHRPAHSI